MPSVVTAPCRSRYRPTALADQFGCSCRLAIGVVDEGAGHVLGRGSPFLSGPLRILDDVEYATMEWIDWYNTRRLHSQLNCMAPEEYETAYYAQTQASPPATPQP